MLSYLRGTLKFTALLTLFVLTALDVTGQQKYWVFFTDKEGVSFDPLTYFDQKAIDRRIKHNIPLNDPSDWAVKQEYIDGVTTIASLVSKSSRWFNALAVQATPSEIKKITELTFVKSANAFKTTVKPLTAEKIGSVKAELSSYNKELLKFQTSRMQGGLFTTGGIDGSGIRVAIFDVGFPQVDTHPALEHIRKAKKIIETYDFVRNKEHVYGHNGHGRSVLSCIAGIHQGTNMGLATGADFLLAITERMVSENFAEEENWVAAIEWADKNGADIVSSSLGYTYHRYFPDEMNGSVSLVARAANKAASKGMLIVNAAGNEGSNNWVTIVTPGDADSVLTIGGIDPKRDMHVNFSSYGPTADKRMKPNVCALGIVVVANKNFVTTSSGTSFSTPLVAGFAACAMQRFPNMTNMDMFKAIEASAHLYPYYDYAHGYGIPQADYFMKDNDNDVRPTFKFEEDEDYINIIQLDGAFDHPDTLIVDKSPIRNLYYNIQNEKGALIRYGVVTAEEKRVLSLLKSEIGKHNSLFVHFEGYTDSYSLKF